MITDEGEGQAKHQNCIFGARTKRSSEVDEYEGIGEVCKVTCREGILMKTNNQYSPAMAGIER